MNYFRQRATVPLRPISQCDSGPEGGQQSPQEQAWRLGFQVRYARGCIAAHLAAVRRQTAAAHRAIARFSNRKMLL